MSKINVLSKQVAELIAAGEVIERPASVIKELVENSIDAHADAITVEIKNGGVTFMRVTDNGTGIEKDDVRNAFLRHATSKIAQQGDLDSIATLGFRGEALASICAVSRVELITKNENETVGTMYRLEGGEETVFAETGCPQGTTFVVRDLFYNVPARMKFLKKDVAESNTISMLIDRIALSHPEISFTFIRDGKQILKTSGNGDLAAAIYQVYGRQFFETLIPVSYSCQGIKLSGFISAPVSSNRASRSMQVFFVNGRYVRTKTGMAAIEQAYKGSIMVGKFPACVLNLEMQCSELDVNVHPAKLEIRFTNEKPVYECVYYGVKTALSGYDTRNEQPDKSILTPTNPKLLGSPADRGTQLGFSYSKPVQDNKSDEEPEIFMPSPADYSSQSVADTSSAARAYYNSDNVRIRQIELSQYRNIKRTETIEDITDDASSLSEEVIKLVPEKENVQKEVAFSTDYTKAEEPAKAYEMPVLYETEQEKLPKQETERLMPADTDIIQSSLSIVDDDKREVPIKYIGEAFSTYIIVEYGADRLMFIDKHAAHERLIYEKLKAAHREQSTQLLLEPVSVTLDKADFLSVMENKELLLEAGFEVDEFGSGTVLIRSVPLLLEKLEITEEFLEIARYLTKHKRLVMTEKMEWIFANTACRAAIKAGNHNNPEELIKIVRDLENNPDVKYCPHGRPIYFFMTKNDLEKSFCRI